MRKTLLCAELNGLPSDLPPERWVELLRDLFGVLAPIGRKEGARLERWGHVLFAVFDESLPALETGYAMQNEFGAFQERWGRQGVPGLFLRVGIATGEVIEGEVGVSDPGVFGPTVTAVQALTSRAPPGGVLVSSESRSGGGGRFEFQALPGPFQPYLLIGPRLETDPERSSARLPSNADVIVRTAAQAGPGRVDNVSAGGMHVSTVLALRIGGAVEVEFSPVPELTGSAPVIVKGTVRHLRPTSDGSPGFGMLIDRADSAEPEAMKHFVALYFSGVPTQEGGYVSDAGEFYRLELGEKYLKLLRDRPSE